MEIEIYSDVVCPWCWIGEQRLLKALDGITEPITLRWRAFQLDPSTPSTGTPLVQSLGRKFGGEANARRMFDHVTEVARGEGLTMNFDRAVSANTFDAHRLIWWADDQRSMAEALHRAHFTDGLDIGSRSDLASVAAGIGHNHQGVLDLLDSETGVAEVHAELQHARQLGVTAVPTFVFDGRAAVSGARDPATLREVLASLDVCAVDNPC